ncbi:(Fe-S)-binding protein [Campylobacter geochelonis]|uniref:(Fe-S)-binding protein n=1 Tax=Campylobacter geochelonis TaxID=1780362 RepID=UPI000770B58C|nr:(Fe-S)-binding protein [Campylobacter geochelonis]CZE46676.1 succinate dehydrogenase/fumarate reductase iron-sulfur subunit [Campylobacter geochelonis]
MKLKFKTTQNSVSECINCSLCTKNCEFLDKFELDLSSFAKNSDLAYNCFLCDKCYEVCPKDIKGSEVSLNLRLQKPRKFKLLEFKKEPYLFENNSEKISTELFFFGCNFVGYFPKTSKKIIEIFEKEGVDFSIDCCGKPLFEAGLGAEKRLIYLNELFKKKKTKRLITACPNCYHFLKPRLDIKVSSLYEKLDEMGLLSTFSNEIDLFFPCPERANYEIYSHFKDKLPNAKNTFSDVNCCGAGGLAMSNEPEVAQNGVSKVLAKSNQPYTYCATCSGRFGASSRHISSLFLGVDEKTNKHYALNVLKFKYYKKGRI